MDRLGLDGELEWIVASTLQVDASYQRVLNEEYLARLMEDFNPNGLRTLEISRRRDGDYILDGQHRQVAVVRKGMGHLRLRCAVYTGLTREQEEEYFILFNNRHLPLNAYHAFKIKMRDPDLTTELVLERLRVFGLTLVPAGVNLGVRQVSALVLLEALERANRLEPVLSVLATAWGEYPAAFRRLHLELVDRLLRDISPEQLVPVLEQIPPSALDRKALTRQSSPGLQLGSYLAVLRDMLGEQAIHQAPR